MQSLLGPISPDHPAGEDLSFSPEFDTIHKLREQDDPSLDQGEWVTSLRVADWPAVLKQSEQLLTQRSKDLRLASWRLEALGHLEAWPGLARGLRDWVDLCEAFWAELHPRVEDGDWDERAGVLRWLLQTVERGAQQARLLGRGRDAYSLQDMAAARHWAQRLERDPQLQQQLDETQPTPDRVAKALKDTPAAQLQQARAAAEQILEELRRLQAWVDAAMGAEAPGFSKTLDQLDDARRQIERTLRDAGLAPDGGASAPSQAEPQDAGSESPRGALAPAAAGPLQSRQQALQQLREVAAFFRRTEPHSPVAYLADKAARWGDMPLHEWLRHVVKDGGTLGALEELLGTEPPHQQE
ncbi:type VI secretion system protein TssA [Pelomonas sp. BJYL3]|uniref:type VI secretion system protein TssA n=1 Tax=Pelomonas sp. BJYL3 TaxID=2976697 RepID=UPI0022B31588|nr:type VI secretion system protein TssA [Pelomonas sp. BJYL3]